MRKFSVKVRTKDAFICYSAIARTQLDVMADAYDVFGVCGVTVRAI